MGFVTVRTATLRGDQQLSFDVYLEINGKHIVYLRSGDSLEGSRIQKLKDKNVKKMFISENDEMAYRSYVMQNVEMALDKKSGVSLESRAQVMQGFQQSNTEAILESPGNESNYTLAKEGAQKYVEFLLKEDKAAQAITNMRNENADLAAHGVSVSTLSVLIASKMGLTDPAKVQLLSLGALVHDIGRLNKPLGFKPVAAMDATERTEYFKHPLEGGEAIRRYRHYDPAVISIIVEHEELINGSGFPNKLNEKNTDPLAVIVSTANDFDRFMIIGGQGQSKADTLKKFNLDRLGLHPLEHFKILKSIV